MHKASSFEAADNSSDSDEETVLSIASSYRKLKNNLLPMPEVLSSKMTREFEFDGSCTGVEITSLDMTSHGCSVLAGCSNGAIFLFDMTSNSRKGVEVGYIRAKGMHTNLLLTVKITEDCRFGFAGVQKGSMEMLAIDLGKLPCWSTKRSVPLRDLITTHSYFDSKLKGFGAVTRLKTKNEDDPTEYRLLCGKGIKNIHIWTFSPSTTKEEPIWTCIVDVPTNGNTIETMSFRKGGYEALSRSSMCNIRMWDLTTHSDTLPNKLTFEDSPNSVDMKTMLGSYAYGGSYDFVAIHLDATSKTDNKATYKLPPRGNEDDSGNRRKRLMREVTDVIGTQDGTHVLALSADGAVFYFHTSSFSVTAEDEELALTEISSLRFEPEIPITWCLRRVGRSGRVVLLRGSTASVDSRPLIRINLLSEEAPELPIAMADLPLSRNSNTTSSSSKWYEWDCYYEALTNIREREKDREGGASGGGGGGDAYEGGTTTSTPGTTASSSPYQYSHSHSLDDSTPLTTPLSTSSYYSHSNRHVSSSGHMSLDSRSSTESTGGESGYRGNSNRNLVGIGAMGTSDNKLSKHRELTLSFTATPTSVPRSSPSPSESTHSLPPLSGPVPSTSTVSTITTHRGGHAMATSTSTSISQYPNDMIEDGTTPQYALQSPTVRGAVWQSSPNSVSDQSHKSGRTPKSSEARLSGNDSSGSSGLIARTPQSQGLRAEKSPRWVTTPLSSEEGARAAEGNSHQYTEGIGCDGHSNGQGSGDRVMNSHRKLMPTSEQNQSATPTLNKILFTSPLPPPPVPPVDIRDSTSSGKKSYHRNNRNSNSNSKDSHSNSNYSDNDRHVLEDSVKGDRSSSRERLKLEPFRNKSPPSHLDNEQEERDEEEEAGGGGGTEEAMEVMVMEVSEPLRESEMMREMNTIENRNHYYHNNNTTNNNNNNEVGDREGGGREGGEEPEQEEEVEEVVVVVKPAGIRGRKKKIQRPKLVDRTDHPLEDGEGGEDPDCAAERESWSPPSASASADRDGVLEGIPKSRKRESAREVKLKKKRHKKSPPPCPAWKHFTESNIVIQLQPVAKHVVAGRDLRLKWDQTMTPTVFSVEKMIFGGAPSFIRLCSFGKSDDSSNGSRSQITHAVLMLHEAAGAQDRLLGQFVSEMVRWSERGFVLLDADIIALKTGSSSGSGAAAAAVVAGGEEEEKNHPEPVKTTLQFRMEQSFSALCSSYRQIVGDLLARQSRELKAAIMLDKTRGGGGESMAYCCQFPYSNNINTDYNYLHPDDLSFQIQFRHSDMFTDAEKFAKTIISEIISARSLEMEAYNSSSGSTSNTSPSPNSSQHLPEAALASD